MGHSLAPTALAGMLLVGCLRCLVVAGSHQLGAESLGASSAQQLQRQLAEFEFCPCEKHFVHTVCKLLQLNCCWTDFACICIQNPTVSHRKLCMLWCMLQLQKGEQFMARMCQALARLSCCHRVVCELLLFDAFKANASILLAATGSSYWV